MQQNSSLISCSIASILIQASGAEQQVAQQTGDILGYS